MAPDVGAEGVGAFPWYGADAVVVRTWGEGVLGRF